MNAMQDNVFCHLVSQQVEICFPLIIEVFSTHSFIVYTSVNVYHLLLRCRCTVRGELMFPGCLESGLYLFRRLMSTGGNGGCWYILPVLLLYTFQ